MHKSYCNAIQNQIPSYDSLQENIMSKFSTTFCKCLATLHVSAYRLETLQHFNSICMCLLTFLSGIRERNGYAETEADVAQFDWLSECVSRMLFAF